ncbi:2-oxoacid:acceptor oxidoreductase [Oribacterium sp. C9]|uniref:4Fe-4S dicluster domain-containing protein n=1 Tax=Oribacterium sp. C9 TaxID=1943579 RepID=UPI00098ECA71|nr:ferredoxin family protein [Oribacterium sp. C9]OON85158.1 2-oxoacid:acceptor oxidoreductase [Oribacterium sp. C9]
MAKFSINVVAERCKSCGYCIKFCPKKVLEIGTKVNAKGYEYVVAARTEDCVGCLTCGKICPDGAIEIYKED